MSISCKYSILSSKMGIAMKNHVNYIALINLRLTEDMLKDMFTKGYWKETDNLSQLSKSKYPSMYSHVVSCWCFDWQTALDCKSISWYSQGNFYLEKRWYSVVYVKNQVTVSNFPLLPYILWQCFSSHRILLNIYYFTNFSISKYGTFGTNELTH